VWVAAPCRDVRGFRYGELVLHPIALAFQDDGLGVMEEPVEHRTGQGGVVVEEPW